MAAGDGSTLYAVDDSAFKMSSIFTIDASTSPATLVKRTHITDANGVFASVAPQGEFEAADLQAMINEDGTVNIDSEGIAVDPAGGFFIVSEGRGTVGDEDRPIESLNFLFKTDTSGVIEKVIVLPEEVNAMQLRFGFEGVAVDGDFVVVAFQRAWGDDANPRIGLYNTVDESWKFLFYPLDEPESQNGGWVGLSEITALGGGKFLVLERDNQGGPDAAIKRIYSIDLGDLSSSEDGSLIEKTLVRDLMSDLKATGGQTHEKLEGMAVLNNEVWIMNDNDAVDDNSGETQVRTNTLKTLRYGTLTNTMFLCKNQFFSSSISVTSSPPKLRSLPLRRLNPLPMRSRTLPRTLSRRTFLLFPWEWH